MRNWSNICRKRPPLSSLRPRRPRRTSQSRAWPLRTSLSSCSTAKTSNLPRHAASMTWATAARSPSGAMFSPPRSRAAAAKFISLPSPTIPAPSTSKCWGTRTPTCPSGRTSSPARPSSCAATICTISTSMTMSCFLTMFCRSSASSARIPPPRATSAWSCTCTPSPVRWTPSMIPARSCAWLTAWVTVLLPSLTTASARATPKPCWPPMPSTRPTPTSS